MLRDLAQMERILAQSLERAGLAPDGGGPLARELLAALEVGDLLDAVSISEEIIRFADGFHPVARFFVEGTPTYEYIVDVLRRSP